MGYVLRSECDELLKLSCCDIFVALLRQKLMVLSERLDIVLWYGISVSKRLAESSHVMLVFLIAVVCADYWMSL